MNVEVDVLKKRSNRDLSAIAIVHQSSFHFLPASVL
jgi:hypothetical protein